MTDEVSARSEELGTKVVLVNPLLEPGMKRYWVPRRAGSALFGTDIADYWFPVAQGGDIAFLYGVLKAASSRTQLGEDLRVRRESHRAGARRAARASRRGSLDGTRRSNARLRPARRERDPGIRRADPRREERRARLEHGHHAAPVRRRRRADDPESRAARGLGRPRQMRRHADPRPLLRARRRGDGRLLPRRFPAANGQRRERRARSEAIRLPRARLARPHRRRDGRSLRRAANSMCSTASAAISSARCPSRSPSRAALANVPLRVHQDIILTDQMFIAREGGRAPAPREDALRAGRRLDFAPPGLKWKRGYDLAVSTRTESDYTASFRCAFDKQGNLYISGGFRRRIEFPEQRRYIIDRMLNERDTEHGVELALHGQALIQELRRDPALRGKSLSGVKVSTDKLTRALTWSPLAEEGKVILIRNVES